MLCYTDKTLLSKLSYISAEIAFLSVHPSQLVILNTSVLRPEQIDQQPFIWCKLFILSIRQAVIRMTAVVIKPDHPKASDIDTRRQHASDSLAVCTEIPALHPDSKVYLRRQQHRFPVHDLLYLLEPIKFRALSKTYYITFLRFICSPERHDDSHPWLQAVTELPGDKIMIFFIKLTGRTIYDYNSDSSHLLPFHPINPGSILPRQNTVKS